MLLTMEPNADGTGVVFGVETTYQSGAETRHSDVSTTSGSAQARCPGQERSARVAATIMTTEDIRLRGAGRSGQHLTSVVVDRPIGQRVSMPTELRGRASPQRAEAPS